MQVLRADLTPSWARSRRCSHVRCRSSHAGRHYKGELTVPCRVSCAHACMHYIVLSYPTSALLPEPASIRHQHIEAQVATDARLRMLRATTGSRQGAVVRARSYSTTTTRARAQRWSLCNARLRVSCARRVAQSRHDALQDTGQHEHADDSSPHPLTRTAETATEQSTGGESRAGGIGSSRTPFMWHPTFATTCEFLAKRSPTAGRPYHVALATHLRDPTLRCLPPMRRIALLRNDAVAALATHAFFGRGGPGWCWCVRFGVSAARVSIYVMQNDWYLIPIPKTERNPINVPRAHTSRQGSELRAPGRCLRLDR